MNRLVSIAPWAIASALCGVSCESFDCRTENESKELLRQVSVPVGSIPAGSAPDLPAGAVVRKQTYTIDKDGDFTFHRSIETGVASLGIIPDTVDPQTAEWLGTEPFSGVLVRSVDPKGAASNAGMRQDDVILTFGGKSVVSVDRLQFLIEARKPDEVVPVEVLRSKEKVKIDVWLGSEKHIDSSTGIRQQLQILDDRDRTGMQIAELTEEARPIVLGSSAAEPGVLVVDVLPGGPAFLAGVKPRDCLMKAGEQPLVGLNEYSSAVGVLESGDDVHFAIRRGREPAQAVVRISSGATKDSGFTVPVLMKYENHPSRSKVSVLMGLLFNHEKCYSVRNKSGAAESYSSRNWGVVLDLIAYEGNSRGKGRLRFLWIIPIWWGN